MKRFILLALAASLPIAAMAQSNYSFDDEVNAELEKMYQQGGTSPSKPKSAPQVQVNVQASPQASTSQSNNQGTTVAANPAQVTDQQVVAPPVQKQPTTLIEAAPAQESKAELLRKSRQDAEVQTEQKIVEKLEQSRLDDEKRRSEVLFGNKFNQMDAQEQAQSQKDDQKSAVKIENSPNAVVTQAAVQAPQQQQAAVAAPVAVAPAPVAVVEPIKEEKKEEIRSESHISSEEIKKEEEPRKNKTYFSGLVGMGDYPGVSNVRGNYALGFAVGEKINDRMMVEGSFTYSNYDVEQQYGGYYSGYGTFYPRITSMDQYQGSAAVKYQLMGGMFRPVVGGVAAYSYRTFSDTQFGSSANNAQSNAIDVGLMAGADLELTESFSLGLDLRYMFNIYNRAESQGFQQSFSQSVYGSGTPIEQLSYLTVGLVARMSF